MWKNAPLIVGQLNRFAVEDSERLQVEIVSPTMRINQRVDCLEYFPKRLIRFPLQPIAANTMNKERKKKRRNNQ